MKDLMVRTHTFTMPTARLVGMVLFAALLSAVPFHAALAATAPDLGTAGSFAVLAGGAVTCTDSTVTGDVGGIPITQTNCTINGAVHQPAAEAYANFLTAYEALAAQQCTQTLDVLAPPASLTFSPGVYCFESYLALTDITFTLKGPPKGIWIFKIGTGEAGGYLEATNFSVVMAGGGQMCNVYWWVEDYATLTTSNFQGTILAGANITVTGGTFNGDALAGGTGSTEQPTGAVTLTNATVAGCEASEGHRAKCNQGVGNGPEGCDPGNSNQGDPNRSNDELGGTPGNPGRKGGHKP